MRNAYDCGQRKAVSQTFFPNHCVILVVRVVSIPQLSVRPELKFQKLVAVLASVANTNKQSRKKQSNDAIYTKMHSVLLRILVADVELVRPGTSSFSA